MPLARLAAVLACAVLLTTAPDVAHAQTADDAFKLQRLNHHFKRVHTEAVLRRKLGGGLVLGLGVFTTGLGAYFLTRECGGGGACTAVILSHALPGAILTTSGGLILALPSREETDSARFLKLAPAEDADPRLVREAVTDGERLLDELAGSARSWRFIAGGVCVVLGGLQVASYYAERDLLDDPRDQTRVVLATVLGSVAWFGFGAAMFAVTSETEDARDAYKDEVARGLPSAERAPRLRLTPSLMPQGGGLAASLTW